MQCDLTCGGFSCASGGASEASPLPISRFLTPTLRLPQPNAPQTHRQTTTENERRHSFAGTAWGRRRGGRGGGRRRHDTNNEGCDSACTGKRNIDNKQHDPESESNRRVQRAVVKRPRPNIETSDMRGGPGARAFSLPLALAHGLGVSLSLSYADDLCPTLVRGSGSGNQKRAHALNSAAGSRRPPAMLLKASVASAKVRGRPWTFARTIRCRGKECLSSGT